MNVFGYLICNQKFYSSVMSVLYYDCSTGFLVELSFNQILSIQFSTVDLGCKEINGAGIKLRYNQGFVIDNVNEMSLYASPTPPPATVCSVRALYWQPYYRIMLSTPVQVDISQQRQRLSLIPFTSAPTNHHCPQVAANFIHH